MENDELKAFVSNCSEKLSGDTWLYEMAFLKTYVKFECFLSEMFNKYCLGETSSTGFCPDRKLKFESLEQLQAFLKGGVDKPYIEYIKIIEKVSKYIFNQDPFSVLFENATYNTYLNQMTFLRNYIAHESDESRNKYVTACLGRGKDFIPAGEFLSSKNKKVSKTNYSIFVKNMEEISDLIISPIF